MLILRILVISAYILEFVLYTVSSFKLRKIVSWYTYFDLYKGKESLKGE